ncbi:TonB-dependent receptor [Geomonas sp. RF6]|uniref:TonB-dependent receptor n=1 Tax=Geomonas sp. RF6 TaxID=2897342 RepID=UPI001E317EB6|nr:TonB-dependent receptor [Geomonas sp. RF6]UFS70972.1 TonB-dependent receptor [Geomonas sp. RF6]
MLSLVIALGTLFIPAVAALAADSAPADFSLGEIVVSGQEEGVESTQTVRAVTEEDIKAKNARTLDQAISLLPGVHVRTGGEGVPRIDVRGFRTRHVVLLLDGIPINSAFDQQFDPALIPTENIAEVKVTVGPSSILYGQGGLGGVINVITKKGVKDVHGDLGIETGDGEPYLLRTSVSGATSKWNYFLSGSSTDVEGFPMSAGFDPVPEQGKGLRKNSDRRRNNVLGTLGYTPSSDLALELTLGYGEGSFGQPTTIVTSGLDPFANTPKYQRVDRFETTLLQLAADYQVSDRFSVRGWGYLSHRDEDDTQYDTIDLDSYKASGSFRAHVSSSIDGVTIQPKYGLGKYGALTASLAVEQDSWATHGVSGTGAGSFAPLDDDKAFTLYSAGIEYEVKPLKDVGVVLGYGHYWQNRSERSDDDYSLLAGVSYQVLDDTRLKAAFKRSVRFPSLGDLYEIGKGEENLAAERAETYEAGVEQGIGADASIAVTGFHTIAKNLIQNDQTVNRNTNLSEVRFYGVEFSAAAQYLKKLVLRASYSYLHSEDRSRAGREEQQYTPGDRVTAEARYDFDSGFTPYASFTYVGNQFFYTKNNVAPVQKLKLNDYTLVNLKLSQRLFDRKVTLYLGADNLLDENYESSYGMPQAGRFIYGGVEFRL